VWTFLAVSPLFLAAGIHRHGLLFGTRVQPGACTNLVKTLGVKVDSKHYSLAPILRDAARNRAQGLTSPLASGTNIQPGQARDITQA
jgi:hypothetical protein